MSLLNFGSTRGGEVCGRRIQGVPTVSIRERESPSILVCAGAGIWAWAGFLMAKMSGVGILDGGVDRDNSPETRNTKTVCVLVSGIEDRSTCNSLAWG